MKTHHLKILRKYLDRIISGQKSFEIRKNDRDYQVGDLVMFEGIPEKHDYITESKYYGGFKIVYIHSGYGMDDNFVVLSIEKS